MTNRLSRNYDPILSATTLVLVALAAGRVNRFPFDDEITTLWSMKVLSKGTGAARLWNIMSEMNPPLFRLIFYAGSTAGLNTSSLRWISLICTASAVASWHWITLDSLGESNQPMSNRLLIAIFFGLTPLAISQGDALRWYPPLALAIAIAFLIYLASSRRWFLSGIAFGVAADTGFIAICPFLAVVVHRWLVERKFRWCEDGGFLLLTGLFATPGFISLVELIRYRGFGGVKAIHYTPNVLRRVMETSLGFFGGVTLGLSQAWLVALAIVATSWLGYRALNWETNQRAARLRDVVLITAAFGAMFTLAGISEPRIYLFLGPMISAVAAIGFAYAMTLSPGLAAASYALLIVVSIAVVANLRASDTPFKRNAAIPYAEVMEFVRANQSGKTIVVTSDAVTEYSLLGAPDICIERFVSSANAWLSARCEDGQSDTVIVVKDAPPDDDDPVWRERTAEITVGKSVVAEAHFGRDKDAGLKNRLTGSRLPSSLVDAIVFRR